MIPAIERFRPNLSIRVKEFNARIEKFGYLRAAVMFDLSLATVIIALRFYHASVTGYILPDEAYYYNTYILAKRVEYRRWLFQLVFQLFFNDVRDISNFLLRGATYCTIWAFGSVIVAYKIVRRLVVQEITAALLMLSLSLFPIFIVMVPLIITEGFALFLALVGILFVMKYLDRSRPFDGLFASLAFLMASLVREHYFLFTIGNLMVIPLSRRKNVSGLIAYCVPLLAVLFYLAYPGTLARAQIMAIVGSFQRSAKIDDIYAFAIGLIYGYNPLFTAFLFASLGLVTYEAAARRSRMATVILVNMVLALMSYLFSLFVIVGSLSAAVTAWTSSIIRVSHTSLPSMFGFRYLYERIKPRNLIAVVLVFLLLATTQIPRFEYAIQRSLTRTGELIDRLSFDYMAPYFRVYLLAKDSGKTLVIGGLHMRGIVTYMSMLPNVVVVGLQKKPGVFLAEEEFRSLLEKQWDTIFLYDDWYTIKDPTIAYAYPLYYRNILLTRTYPGFNLEVLWIDGESYAMKMVKTNASASTDSETNLISLS